MAAVLDSFEKGTRTLCDDYRWLVGFELFAYRLFESGKVKRVLDAYAVNADSVTKRL